MALTKKLQKTGNSRMLVLEREMLALLGLEEDDAPEVTLSVYGDSLVVRRADAKPLNLQQVGQLFGLEPWDALELPQKLDFSDVEPALREVLELLQNGPLTAGDISEILELKAPATSNRLKRAQQHNHIFKEGKLYRLNTDLFSG